LDEQGNRSWNGMLFSSKKALLLNFVNIDAICLYVKILNSIPINAIFYLGKDLSVCFSRKSPFLPKIDQNRQ
jgi:hypothetical protein